MIAHSRTMSSSFAVQFALAIGVFYELGFGLVNLSPMAAFGLAVLPFVAVVVAPAFLTGAGRRAHDGKYLLWRFIAVQLVAVGLAAVAFGNLAWLQVPACFLLLAGVACLKRADLLDKGSDAPAVRLAIAFPLCLVVIMVLCCLAAIHHLDWGVAELGLLLAAVSILASLLPSLLAAGEPKREGAPVPWGLGEAGQAQSATSSADDAARSLCGRCRNAMLGPRFRLALGLACATMAYFIYAISLVAAVCVPTSGLILFRHQMLPVGILSLGTIWTEPLPAIFLACFVISPAGIAMAAFVFTILAPEGGG